MIQRARMTKPRGRPAFLLLAALGAAELSAQQPPAAPAPASVPAARPAPPRLDTARLEALTGARGAEIPQEGVFKVSVSRDDLGVQVDGMRLPAGMGLTSWAAFSAAPAGGLAVMGDLVLLEDEVSPVMDEALGGGLEVTALHNHFLFDRPRVFFMHVSGHGRMDDLAGAVGKCLAKVKSIRAAHPSPAGSFGGKPVPPGGEPNTAEIDSILRGHGDLKGGVYKLVFGRAAAMRGVPMGSAMGVNTWAAFYGGPADALVDGDFAMHEDEVQHVLKTLRQGGIHIVAIHNHMIGETPRFVFLHYWGRGPSASLAHTLRFALDLLSPGR